MFKIGDKVKIRKDSIYYTQKDNNPKDIRGSIRAVNDCYELTHIYSVGWENGFINTYRPRDLELWEETKEETMVNYNVLSETIILSFDGKRHSVDKDSKLGENILQAIRENRLQDIPSMFKDKPNLANIDGVTIEGSLLKIDGIEVSSRLHNRILDFLDQELPIDALVKFVRKLNKNPSFNSRKMLYDFLEHNGHPITQNGNFIAYRGVSTDFKDLHTGKFDNSAGSVCSMDRALVDDNPDNTCSHGLHVACYDYARGFGRQLIEVEVNPENVVCVPRDYNGTKMRVCEFKVVSVCENIREESYLEVEDDEFEDDFCDYGFDEDYEDGDDQFDL